MSPVPASHPSEFDALVRESEELESNMAQLQAEVGPVGLASDVRAHYRDWHVRARRLLDPAGQSKLDELRDGSMFSVSIHSYLNDPTKVSPLYNSTEPNPLIPRWQVPFDQVREKLERQRQLLAGARPHESDSELVALDLASTLRRLPTMLKVFERRRPEWTIGEAISDERDLQIVVEAFLRTLFDDVRPEDFVSSVAGRNARVDFVLPEVGVVVETKMTRSSLNATKLAEELLIDAGRYPNHPDCGAIVALVYDPGHWLDNPRGIERDLTLRTASGLSFICVVTR